MDVMRFGYTAFMQFYTDPAAPLVEVRWYPVDDAPLFTEPTPFRSQVWRGGPDAGQGGEFVSNEASLQWSGDGPPPVTFIGDQVWNLEGLRFGVESPPNPPLLCVVEGVPVDAVPPPVPGSVFS